MNKLYQTLYIKFINKELSEQDIRKILGTRFFEFQIYCLSKNLDTSLEQVELYEKTMPDLIRNSVMFAKMYQVRGAIEAIIDSLNSVMSELVGIYYEFQPQVNYSAEILAQEKLDALSALRANISDEKWKSLATQITYVTDTITSSEVFCEMMVSVATEIVNIFKDANVRFNNKYKQFKALSWVTKDVINDVLNTSYVSI